MWRFNAQADRITLNFENRDYDIVSYDDAFVHSPCQDKHGASLRKEFYPELLNFQEQTTWCSRCLLAHAEKIASQFLHTQKDIFAEWRDRHSFRQDALTRISQKSYPAAVVVVERGEENRPAPAPPPNLGRRLAHAWAALENAGDWL